MNFTLVRVTMVFGAVAALLVLAAALHLTDRPGRAALGARRVTEGASGVVEYFASGDGVPVVLLASYARPAADFNELVGRLVPAGYRTLAVSSRGIGASSLGPLDASYHDLAEDVARVLGAEGIDAPALIVGHAFGNRIARTFAADYPDRVSALVLVAAGGQAPTPPDFARRIPWIVFARGFEERRRRALEYAFFAPGNRAPDHWIVGWYPLAAIVQGRATALTPLDGWERGGVAPILLLQPAEDRAAPVGKGGHDLVKRLGERVSYHLIPDAGHAALPEQGDRIASHILAFFSRWP